MMTPGTFVRINSAARSERSGPTPTKMNTRWCKPKSRTLAMNWRRRGTSKQYCVWIKSAPASTFLAKRSGRHSYGCTKGLEAAPRKSRGGTVSLRPLRNMPLSRMILMVRSRCKESKSKTRLASGWSPVVTSSPVRQSTLQTPMAAAPRTSPWMAMRLRSRQETCSTGA